MIRPKPGRPLRAAASRWLLFGSLVVLLSMIALPVLAADDSNSMNFRTNGAISNQQISTAISTLSQNLTDPALKQSLSQLASQLNSGNTAGAASTLATLQTDANNDPQASAGLKALLQSLSVGQNGLSLNSSKLASQLGVGGSPLRLPNSLANESPQQLTLDLSTLATLLQGVDPALAAQMLNMLQLGGSGANVSLPGSVNVGGLKVPGMSVPSVNLPTVGAPSSFDPIVLLVPFAVVIAAGIYVFRGRLLTLFGKQTMPSASAVMEDEGLFHVTDPNDRRQSVYFSFSRAVQIMRARGVPKKVSETHREFSAKTVGRPEGEAVRTVSEAYEKARFTKLEVEDSDVANARTAVDALETPG